MTNERLPNREIRLYDSDGIINGLNEKIKLFSGEDGREARGIENVRTALQIEKALKNHIDVEKEYNLKALPYYYVFTVGYPGDRKPALFRFNRGSLIWESNFTDSPDGVVSGRTAEDTLNRLLASGYKDGQKIPEIIPPKYVYTSR